MDILYWQSLIQGIIQGLTEFLPISSTGHMILADRIMEAISSFRAREQFINMFEIVVQLGSIIAVVVYFHNKLLPMELFQKKEVRDKTFDIWFKTLAGVIPALLVGGLFGSVIQKHLYTPCVVAIALIAGGIILLLVDKTRSAEQAPAEIRQLSYKKVLGIGCIQCLAMIPGTSRSASTIIGAMALGCTRPLAAEYSFFLAIPTMVAASGYSLLKHGAHLTQNEWIAMAIGFITSFFVAWGVIAGFMAYIRTRDFKPFAWYRIVLGSLILILLYFKIL